MIQPRTHRKENLAKWALPAYPKSKWLFSTAGVSFKPPYCSYRRLRALRESLIHLRKDVYNTSFAMKSNRTTNES